MTKRNIIHIKETRWIIVNVETGIMPTRINESFKRTAILSFVNDWANVGVNKAWDEWYKQGFRAVKTVIEVDV